MSKGYIELKNNEGEVIYIAGQLPDGTYGIIADESRPFTDNELHDQVLFRAHCEELAKRVDKKISDNS